MKVASLTLRVRHTLDEVLHDLASLGTDATVLAGGQSLIPMLRYRLTSAHVLVDISRVAELRQCAWDQDVSLGAATRHADLAGGPHPMPAVQGRLGELLAAHAAEIAFPAVRTRGTVGGSLAHADPKADWPVLLCALGARVELRSLRTTRLMDLTDFIVAPMQNARLEDELLTRIQIPATNASPLAWGRSKLTHRAGEYALSLAVAVRQPKAWSCWLGCAAQRPLDLDATAVWLDQQLASGAPPEARWRARLMSQVHDELSQLLDDVSDAQLYRHATTVADAVQAAWRMTTQPPEGVSA